MNQIQVREAHDGDALVLAELVAGLSPRSAFLRFFAGVGRPSARMVDALLRRDDTHGAWVAELRGRLVGHASWGLERPTAGSPAGSPADGVGHVEVGVVVADSWHGRGLGRTLFQRALAEAAGRGYERVGLNVHAENVSLARRLARGAESVSQADGVVTVVRPLHDFLLRRPDQVLVA